MNLELSVSLAIKVSSLESYMEALPSLFVLLYLKIAEPDFFLSSNSSPAVMRAYWVASFTMTNFLKNGPCFFLPRGGFFSGMLTWKFWAVLLVNHYSLYSKICWTSWGGQHQKFFYQVRGVCRAIFY